MNYTKYVLKDNEELQQILAEKDNLFVIACNKCYKEFDTVNEPECGQFEELAAAQGKTIKGTTFVSTTTTIALVDLMEGLRIGVRHMTVGANYTLYAPYYLMFGATPTERTYDGKAIQILPYSALVYDVELLSIIKPGEK